MRHEKAEGVLLAVAFGGVVVGAICAVVLTTYAGVRVGSPLILRLLFAVSPNPKSQVFRTNWWGGGMAEWSMAVVLKTWTRKWPNFADRGSPIGYHMAVVFWRLLRLEIVKIRPEFARAGPSLSSTR